MNVEQKLLEKWRELPLDKQQEVLQFVESLKEDKLEIKERPFGLCKGEFTVPDDFNKPLPDEILDNHIFLWFISGSDRA